MFFLTPRPADSLRSEGELEYPLAKLLGFTEHKDTIRRGGLASILKLVVFTVSVIICSTYPRNCAFQTQAHRAMLFPESEKVAVPPSDVEAPGIDMLAYLLLPLAGPEEYDLEVYIFLLFIVHAMLITCLQEQELLPAALQFLPPTKKREVDPVIRLTHVESLLLLCTTFWGREYLRSHGVYEVVRVLHENETVDKISEQVERLVNFLKRDEGTETKNDAELDVHVGAKIKEVEEDEDDMIIEV